MEIRHTICRQLTMNIGEVGPVEVELIYSIIFLLAGIFGTSFYETPLSLYLWLFSDTNIQVKHIVTGLSILLAIVFTLDNVGDALKKNATETLKLFSPVLILFAIGLFSV